MTSHDARFDVSQGPATSTGTSKNEDVSPPDNVSDLTQWFKYHRGYLHPQVVIGKNEHVGYYMRAGPEGIEAPFYAVGCPLWLSLSWLNIDPKQPYVPCVKTVLRPLLDPKYNVSRQVLGRLLLLEQLVLEHTSYWHPYIVSLPDQDEILTPLSKDFDSKYFDGTSIPEIKRKQLKTLKEEWTNARSAMEEVGLRNSELYHECDFDNYMWAFNIFSSRAFSSRYLLPGLSKVVDAFPILLPVLDIANHDMYAKTRWVVPLPDREGNIPAVEDLSTSNTFTADAFDGPASAPKDSGDMHGDVGQSLMLRIIEDVAPQAEIFNNYGPKSNTELLFGYGFALENNRVEQFPLKMKAYESLSEHIKDGVVPFRINDLSLKDESAGLRKRDNVLGRYQNDMPFFQGIPGHVVLGTYLVVLGARNIDPKQLKRDGQVKVPSRIVLGTLVFLYEALHARCEIYRYQYTEPSSFKNAQDKYAWYYLKGQADVVHSVRRELKAVLEKLRIPRGLDLPSTRESLRTRSCIATLSDVLKLFRIEYPRWFGAFEAGMAHLFTRLDISNSEDLARSNAEPRMWVFLLAALDRVTLELERCRDGSPTLLSSWMADLRRHHKTTPNEGSAEGTRPKVNGRGADDFRRNIAEVRQQLLDRATDHNKEASDLEQKLWGPVEDLDWPLRAVVCEMFIMADSDYYKLKRWCIYMTTERSDENWMYEQVEIPPQEPEEHIGPAPLGERWDRVG